MGLADAIMQPDGSGIDPQLLQQLMGLGSVDQRHQLLQQQLGRADQLSAGTPIDYTHGKGTPLLLASLANLISSGVGGYQGGKAVAGEQALVDQTGQTRSAFSKALMGASAPVPQPGQPGAPPEMLAAPDYQATEEKKRSGLLSALQGAGLMSGDPAIMGAVKAGPQMALEGQQVAAGQRAAEAATSPATGAARRILLKQFGVEAPEGTPNATLNEMIGPAEKAYAAHDAAEARREAARSNADLRKLLFENQQERNIEKRWTQFGQELDPTKARGGEMGKVVNSLTQYGKVKTLIDQNPNPNTQQMYEIARTFDRAVSGGTATEGGTEHLIPQTALGSAKDFEQWLVNSPQGRNQQAFVKQIADSVARETNYGTNLLRQWQGKKASRYSDLAKGDPDRFAAELQNWGLQPEEFDPNTWVYKGQPKPQTDTSDLRKKYGL